MPLKVIGASFPKTGTKSLWRAMDHLGFNHVEVVTWVDHMLDEWVEFMKGNAPFDLVHDKFNELNGESFSDMPFNLYWEEFYKRNPNCKVILGVRDSDDQWYASFRRYCDALAETDILAGAHTDLAKQDENYAKWIWVLEDHWRQMFGTEKNPFTQKSLTKKDVDHFLNEPMLKQRYRMHNAYVKSVVPADKLLFFNPKDGWEPLCKFLNVPVPDVPFPRDNQTDGVKASQVIANWAETKLVKGRDATVERLLAEKK